MNHKRLLLPFLFGLPLLLGLGTVAAKALSIDGAEQPPLAYSVSEDAGVAQPAPTPAAPAVLVEAAAQLAAFVTPVATRADERVAMRSEPGEVRIVEGRLVLPRGATHEHTLNVVALGASLLEDLQPGTPWPGDRTWHQHEVLARAEVEKDGAFHLELPAAALEPESAEVHLDVDGRFLYLLEPVAFDPTSSAAVVLEPELGGAISGRLKLPRGASEKPSSVRVGGLGTSNYGGGMTRVVEIEGTLEFELRALQPELRFVLSAASDIHPATTLEEGVLVEAGRVVDTRIELTQGATVRGQVVDTAGAPLANVEVWGDSGSSFTSNLDAGRAQTAEDGRFELRGLAVREQVLNARHDAFLDGESEVLALAEGQAIEDLSIVLDEGLDLKGAIRWPDGEAAVGARLTVIPIDPSGSSWRLFQKARSEEGSGRTAEDGSFRVGGLLPGAYGLFAELAPRDETSAASTPWTVRLESVEAGTVDLALTLAAPLVVAGRVLDDAGVAVEAFTVSAERANWPTWIEGSSKTVEKTCADAAGRFELDGLDAGEWKVHVLADGHLRSDERAVTAPGTDAEPFALTRTARIEGVVLDPNGLPVAGAEVRAIAQETHGHTGVEKTDADGRYVLESVGPGPIALRASSEDWAPSLEDHFDVASGEQRSEWTVHLTHGGRLEGLVFDSDGAPDPERTIAIQSNEGGEYYEVFSDANGHFVAEHVAPGTYQVIATPDYDAFASTGSDEPDLGELFAEMRMTMVTAVADETVEIVLGAPPRAPVVVHGRVLRDGEPVPRAGVLVLAESGSLLESMRADSADEDGAFEVQVDEPGDYTFVIMASFHDANQVDFQVTLPKVERFELDLVLPGGSIPVRVRHADGSVAEAASLWIRREDGVSDLSSLMSQSLGPVEDDGTYEITTLHPGSYAITAVGGGSGKTTVHGVVVPADGSAPEVTLTLPPAGTVSGTVVDESGVGVPDATVLLRDAEGRPLFELDDTTDRKGAFEISHVPAGDVFVTAHTEERVSLELHPARVLAGQDTRVDFALQPGTQLSISLEDEDGEPLRAAIRVENESGYEFAGCAGLDDFEDLSLLGVSSTERRVGPLPPGRYTLRATSPDGRSAKETVTLREDARERTVRLRLKE